MTHRNIPAERCFLVMLSTMNCAFDTRKYELLFRVQLAYVVWHSYCSDKNQETIADLSMDLAMEIRVQIYRWNTRKEDSTLNGQR
eukprot:7284134-Karenia_brevis.AAC.1